MGKSFKYIVAFIGAVVLLLLGWYVGSRPGFFHKEKEVHSSVVLEKIKAVSKLTTVEADFSEIYSYKDYYSYDFSPLRKKALLRVKAKVSAGIDLDKMNIVVDSVTHTVTIEGIPPAEIFSIDHDLEYYDISEGVFNDFSTEDYNHINANAKKYIEDIAKNSGVLLKAQNQSADFIETITLMIKGMGYDLIIKGPRKGID